MISILEEVIKGVRNKESIALVIIVDVSGSSPGKLGSKMVVNKDGLIAGTIGGGSVEAKVIEEAKLALKAEKAKFLTYQLTKEEASLEDWMICGGSLKLFIDVFTPQEEMVIFGAGHIAMVLSKFAKMIGFRVTIIDERKEFANKERFPEADQIIISGPSQALKEIKSFNSVYVVILTRGHLKDEEALLSVINYQPKYIGMIGSKQKNTIIFQHLKEKGVNQEKIDKVFAPIGLRIGAQTPEEIAISIIAEVIKVKRGKS
ncbi:MAG: XdhC/CoxI family protein [Atribacterota bacterium]|nr:XdhC/CoxI family protein [Atribacterota bacterium]MDD4896573.1 XdhC/CoxI family protein [Atribacterota bacterium]MDD5636677.1 XdhC/CoxI family protein [Atribacterota bacterium]